MNNHKNQKVLSDMLVSNLGTFVNEIFNETTQAEKSAFRPRLEFIEGEKAYKINVLLPGLTKKDIFIKQEDSMLTISGEKTKEENTDKRLVDEFYYGKFSRSIRLPKNADLNNSAAVFQNGILTITVGKKEDAQPKFLEIK